MNVKSAKFSRVSAVCSLESRGREGWGIGTSGAPSPSGVLGVLQEVSWCRQVSLGLCQLLGASVLLSLAQTSPSLTSSLHLPVDRPAV